MGLVVIGFIRFEQAKRADRPTGEIPGVRGNWKKCSGVLCDKKMPVKLKGKIHIAVRPTFVYGAETWSTTKANNATGGE